MSEDEANSAAEALSDEEARLQDDEHLRSDEPNPQLLQLMGLLEAEIERLRVNLDNLRMIQGPEQRELIRRQVAALDERQDALADLQRLIRQSEVDVDSGKAPPEGESVH